MLQLLLVGLVVLFATEASAQPPGAPQNFASSVNGDVVTLTWSAPASGGAPTTYFVEASAIPNGPIVASLAVAATSLTVPNVPTGTYYVYVRAQNASGLGPISAVITVVVTGGCPGPPVAPRLIARSVAFLATLSWGSGGGCAPTSYTLLAGTGPGLSNVAQANMGGQLGLSATAPAGTYYVRVVGANAWGSAVSEDLAVRLAANAQTDTLLPNNAVFFDVTMTATGTYTASLVWDDATLDLDLYFTSPGCSYPPTGCLLAISDRVGVNNEQISFGVQAGQVYRIWVDNLTQRTTSFAIFSTIAPAATAPDLREAGELRITKQKQLP